MPLAALGNLYYRLFPSRASLAYCQQRIEAGKAGAAMPALRRQSAAGNAEAAYLLGQLYNEGKLLPRNAQEALRLFLLAANMGHLGAADQLGALFLFGANVSEGMLSTVSLQTDSQSTTPNPLAGLFDAAPIHRDYQQAAYWNQQAAQQGVVAAQSRLGLQHALGLGLEKDLHKATTLLNVGAEAEDELGLLASGIHYLGGFGGAPNPLLAREYLQPAATKPHGLAQVLLALTYMSGPVADWQPQQAQELLLPAANQGNASAMFYLGELARGGHVAAGGLPAESWMRRAAAKGHIRATTTLVRLLTSGERPSAPLEAASLCRQAADAGDGEGMFLLAHLYLKGTGLLKNDTFAFRWAQKSADAGFKPSTELLAWMHMTGTGTATDAASALNLLSELPEPLSAEAQEMKRTLLKTAAAA